MSEIKGQLLGIILTIAIFGVVLTAMVASFGKMSETVGSRVEEIATTEITYTPGSVEP